MIIHIIHNDLKRHRSSQTIKPFHLVLHPIAGYQAISNKLNGLSDTHQTFWHLSFACMEKLTSLGFHIVCQQLNNKLADKKYKQFTKKFLSNCRLKTGYETI